MCLYVCRTLCMWVSSPSVFQDSVFISVIVQVSAPVLSCKHVSNFCLISLLPHTFVSRQIRKYENSIRKYSWFGDFSYSFTHKSDVYFNQMNLLVICRYKFVQNHYHFALSNDSNLTQAPTCSTKKCGRKMKAMMDSISAIGFEGELPYYCDCGLF